MRRLLIGIPLLLAALALGWFSRGYVAGTRPDRHATDGRPQRGGRGNRPLGVTALGRLRPVGGVVEIHGVTGDRVKRLCVKEGDLVQADQELLYLDSGVLREFELRAVTRQFEEATARRKAEKIGADAKVDAARLALEKAKLLPQGVPAAQEKLELAAANLDLAKKDQTRLAGLSEDLATDQDRERQALLVKQAQAECVAAEISLKQLLATNELALQGAQADLASAEDSRDPALDAIPVRSLEVARDLAQVQLERATLKSPIAGKVLRILVHEGESLRGTPIMQVADVQRMGAVVEIHEDLIGRVRTGQLVRVYSRALPSPWNEEGLNGKVLHTGQQIGPQELRAFDPFAPTDHRVVQVRVQLDDSRPVADLTNLEVEVVILTDASGGPAPAPAAKEG